MSDHNKYVRLFPVGFCETEVYGLHEAFGQGAQAQIYSI
jgi:hypothetical protein